jgi:hypothetical protein
VSINEINIDVWFQQLADAKNLANKDTPHIVVGYGSLMSKHSRDRHSNIKSLPLSVVVNGCAFYTNIDKKLLQREQDYRFSKLQLDNLDFGLAANSARLEVLYNCTIYVCETLERKLPSKDFPVNASYIDTCLKGCLEVGGIDEVKRFVNSTKHWPDVFKLDDRLNPKYPRASAIRLSDYEIFD